MSLLSPSLEAFWAITRKGTVQDASKILGITQTGVTQRIRSLEKQLQTTLFIRSRTGMKLTTEGEALLQYVKGSLDIEGMALSKIQRAATNNIIEINISGPPSLLRSRVIPNLAHLKSHYPLLRFRFDLSDWHHNVDKLKSGFSDFTVLEQSQVTREMDYKNLKTERYCLYGPASWKRRLFKDILKGEPLITLDSHQKISEAFFEKNKLRSGPHSGRHSTNDLDALISMVSRAYGYAVLPEELASAFVKSGQICKLQSDDFFDFKLALAWYPRAKTSEHFQAIIKSLN